MNLLKKKFCIVSNSKHTLLALTGVCLTLCISVGFGSPAYAQKQAAKESARATLMSFENAFTEIADEVSPAVVSIRTEKTIQAQGTPNDMFPNFPFGDLFPNAPKSGGKQHVSGAGSGVIVRADGYILTNDHVVGGADEVTVVLKDKREFKGKVIRDPRGDLALVKIDAKNLPIAKLGDSSKVHVGSWAIALGNPFGLSNTLTVGVISAMNRSQIVGDEDMIRNYPDLLQTDAAINPGNSGGPLVNINGEVIGINTAIESTSGGSVGIGFAIPINTAKDVMNDLIQHGHVIRGWLGVRIGDLSSSSSKPLGVTEGGLVYSVERNSPAEEAGIHAGDVIVEYNGEPVTSSSDVTRLVGKTKPDTTVKIVIVRDKKRIPVTAKIVSMPDQIANGQTESTESGKGIGVTVKSLTSSLRNQLDLPADTKGVVVTSVDTNSAAAQAGIQVKDIITKVGSAEIVDPSDFTKAVSGLSAGDTVMLTIQRGSDAPFICFVQVPEDSDSDK